MLDAGPGSEALCVPRGPGRRQAGNILLPVICRALTAARQLDLKCDFLSGRFRAPRSEAPSAIRGRVFAIFIGNHKASFKRVRGCWRRVPLGKSGPVAFFYDFTGLNASDFPISIRMLRLVPCAATIDSIQGLGHYGAINGASSVGAISTVDIGRVRPPVLCQATVSPPRLALP